MSSIIKSGQKDTEASINNGISTLCFSNERGTRQGDPLSPYLLILVLEILFVQVRNDDQIKGLKVVDLTIKLTAFAGDTTFFVQSAFLGKKSTPLWGIFNN